MHKSEKYITPFGTLGIILQLLSTFRSNGEAVIPPILLLAVGTLLLIVALGLYAKSKGYSYYWSLLGLFSLPGVLAVSLFPNKNPSARHSYNRQYNEQPAKLCLLFSFIFFVLSLNSIFVNGTTVNPTLQNVFSFLFYFFLISSFLLYSNPEHEYIESLNKPRWWKFIAHIPILRLVTLTPPDMNNS